VFTFGAVLFTIDTGCSSRKDYSGYLEITGGWRAHLNRLFVGEATATSVKYTMTGRSWEKS